ncbi:uncharacterized protein LOC111319571, partial [Stylophora pistillata]
MAYAAQQWSFLDRVGKVTLHCKKCDTVLATRETVMLAKVPPSGTHLAVREGKEEHVEGKLHKVKNEKGGNSALYCPFNFLCRGCGERVANVTKLAGKQLICFRIERVNISHNGKRIMANKLSKVSKELEEECGIEVVNVTTHAPETGRADQSRGDSEAMVYCDTSGWTHTSHEIDSLTRQEPRDYQRELFLSAMRGNTLVYLPTGSGKTLIAAMVMSCMKKLNPSKVMVFLVDRVPLAHQQRDYTKSQLIDLKVEMLVGEMESPQNRRIYHKLANNKVDVLVLTHQIFLNFLAAEDNPPIRLSDVSVLVFDEAHHCSRNHPYNKIMEYYKKTPNRFKPVVLGLTASPAGELTFKKTSKKLEKLLENLESAVAMPIESDLLIHVNIPDVIYERSDHMNTDQVLLQRHIEEHIKYLIDILFEDVPDRQDFPFPVFSSNFRGALRKLIESYHGNTKSFEALIVVEHAMHLLSVVEFCDVLGYQYAVESLKECVYRIVSAKSRKHRALNRLIGSQRSFQALKNLVDQACRADYPRAVVMSDRYKILVKHLEQFLHQVREDPTSRGIIFVNLRKTTFKMCEQIRRDIPIVTKMLNPYPFVGHGQGSYDGMTWKDEQEKLLRKFREGESKLLICTSVLEEGLDIPECNLVVRFEGAATLRALVQTRGRASRRSNSKFVVICNEKQEKDAKDLCLKEQNMEEAINCLMKNPRRQSQAEEFECEAKKPKLFLPSAEESGADTSPVMRYSPRISVTVRNMVYQTSRVIEFLNDNFDVISSKPIQSTSSAGEALTKKPTSEDMAFELEPSHNEEAKEFRSKEEFACHATEVWCMRLTDRHEEPLPTWLQAPPLETRRKSIESFHWLKASSLCLGTFMSRCHFQCEWPLEPTLKDIKINFDHSFKMLTLHSSRQSSVVLDQGAVARVSYKIELRYEEIEDFIIVDTDSSAEAINVFLTARHPPRLYKHEVMEDLFDLFQVDEQDDEDDSVVSTSDDESETEGFLTDDEYADVITADFNNVSSDLSRNLTDYISWERASDFHNGENTVSQCFTYCVTIPFNEVVQLRRLLTTVEKRFHKSVFYCRVKESYGKLRDVEIPDSLPYDVKYAAGSVLSFHPLIRGRVLPGKFGGLLLSKSSNIAIAALEKLSKVLEKDKFCDPGTTLESLLKQENPSTSGMYNRLVPGHCALIKRAVITPTRLLFYPPEVMVKNRVLRNYDTDDFLCVSIRDEDLSKLSAARGNIHDILDGVNRKLNEGLVVGGQRFQFLGSSNSQLRNHSCWFVGPSSLPDDIRRWMGDFTNIKCVASYMARMGQCFSTSLDAVGFATSEDTYHEEEDDVKTADGEYCFSDGVGKISEELAAEVVRQIGKPFKPSAFQVRFAGYKGVLALDPRLPGKQAIFRESMSKFDSFHRRLEVLQTSRPQVVFLNHQVIMLLSNLGVPDEVFIKLQNDMLDKLAGMLVNERDAIQLLGSGAKVGVSYHNVSNAGIPLTTEPFFKSLLVAMYRNHMHELLSRARILLPPAEARLMMGVMDELGVLKPGQVFVQYSAVETREDRDDEFDKNKKIVLSGPVVVTRNPCLHPGDVRQLEAVDVPGLFHLVDCIVFPSRGSRTHPNEMAGGDLDGDLYFVCWNKDLLPRKPNYPPMDYPSLPKLEQTEPIATRDMTKFVVDYIRSDQLGVIDNAHKALADIEKDGVRSKKCLFLAKLHSLAVDAPKTGKWPDTTGIGIIEKLPDFMMKSHKPSYPSEKVLGKLYRRCRKFKDTTSEKYDQKVRLDESFLLPGNDRFVE